MYQIAHPLLHLQLLVCCLPYSASRWSKSTDELTSWTGECLTTRDAPRAVLTQSNNGQTILWLSQQKFLQHTLKWTSWWEPESRQLLAFEQPFGGPAFCLLVGRPFGHEDCVLSAVGTDTAYSALTAAADGKASQESGSLSLWALETDATRRSSTQELRCFEGGPSSTSRPLTG